MKVDNRFINKEKTALWISEVFGCELPPNKLHRYKIKDDYLFFECEEKHLYPDYYYDDSPILIFVVQINNIYGELYTDIDSMLFSWKDKDISSLVNSYNRL